MQNREGLEMEQVGEQLARLEEKIQSLREFCFLQNTLNQVFERQIGLLKRSNESVCHALEEHMEESHGK